MFWLDGHLSNGITSSGDEETPLMKELAIIVSNLGSSARDFVIVIDDFHEILQNPSYPKWDQLKYFADSNLLNFETKWNFVIMWRSNLATL